MEEATTAVVWEIFRELRGASVDLCRSRFGGRIEKEDSKEGVAIAGAIHHRERATDERAEAIQPTALGDLNDTPTQERLEQKRT